MGDRSGADAHAKLMASLYPEALVMPLTDHYDHSVPGGFPVALARARAAGLPENLLTELEATHAMFEADFPAFAAALPRLQAARAGWQERTSLCSSLKEFDLLLAMATESVRRESVAPGSFAQTAAQVRKRDIARAVYNDLREVDRSCDLYFLLHRCRTGDPIPLEGWLACASTKTHVWANRGADVLGHPFGQQRVGTQPAVPVETYKAVADAVPDSFWTPFLIPGATANK